MKIKDNKYLNFEVLLTNKNFFSGKVYCTDKKFNS